MAIDVRRVLSRQRNILRGSDPGYGRLRQAVSGAGAMATALVPAYFYARLLGADTKTQLISMLLAAMIAMMGSMALSGTEVWPMVRTAVFFPVAIGAGMTVGTLLADHTGALLAMFVVIVFLAVYIRRFGLPFFFYGFMLWIGYFFATFLHPTVGMLPELIGAAAVGAAWVLLLSATVLRVRPDRVLSDVRRTFDARAVDMITGCDALLTADTDRGARRAADRIHGRHVRLQETALMTEAWSADTTAVPAGWTASGLRRRTLEWTLAIDRLAGCTEQIANGPETLRMTAASMLGALADGDHAAASATAELLRRQARTVEGAKEGGPAARLSVAALQLAGAVGDLIVLFGHSGRPPADVGSEADAEEAEFSPTVTLALGNLPGSPAVARDVAPRAHRWNPLSHLSFTSRQAVQVAVACGLAIWIGRELDATRYYWAVIAAFIAFTGTGSRSETFIKSANRVIGTLAGLFAGIFVAHLTAGNTPLMLAVIILSMFCGLYLVRVGYGYMIFFITIMVSQLYGILHEFSDHLLMLRLEETIIGAACGIAVALVVAPLSTRDTVGHVQTSLLTTLGDLLDAAADTISERDHEDAPVRCHRPSGSNGDGENDGSRSDDADEDGPQTPGELIVDLDNRLRQLQLVAKPLTRPLLWDNSPRATRHRLTVYGGLIRTARAATAALPHRPGTTTDSGTAGSVVTGPPAAIGSDMRAATPGEINIGTAEVYRLVAAAARVAADRPVPLGAGHSEPDDALTAAIGQAEQRIESLVTTLPDGADERPAVLASRLIELLAATGGDGQIHASAESVDAATAARA